MKHGDELKPGMFVAVSRDRQRVEAARKPTRLECVALALGAWLIRYGSRLRDYGTPPRPLGVVTDDGKIATHGMVKIRMDARRDPYGRR